MEKNTDENDENPFRYCGEYFDKETNTVYLRARYYDPIIGRFISRDSYAGKDQDPLSLNLYTYCHNNPVLFTDASGHKANSKLRNTFSSSKKIPSWFNESKNFSKYQKFDIKSGIKLNNKKTVKEILASDRIIKKDVSQFKKSSKKPLILEQTVMKKVDPLIKIAKVFSQTKYAKGTLSFGGDISASTGGWGFSAGLGFCIDAKGNIGLQVTPAVSLDLGTPGLSASGFLSANTANTIYDLNGFGMGVGVTGGAYGVIAGGSVDVAMDEKQDVLSAGGTINFGAGSPQLLGTVSWSNTIVLPFGNVYNWYDTFYKKVMEK